MALFATTTTNRCPRSMTNIYLGQAGPKSLMLYSCGCLYTTIAIGSIQKESTSISWTHKLVLALAAITKNDLKRVRPKNHWESDNFLLRGYLKRWTCYGYVFIGIFVSRARIFLKARVHTYYVRIFTLLRRDSKFQSNFWHCVCVHRNDRIIQ